MLRRDGETAEKCVKIRSKTPTFRGYIVGHPIHVHIILVFPTCAMYFLLSVN